MSQQPHSSEVHRAETMCSKLFSQATLRLPIDTFRSKTEQSELNPAEDKPSSAPESHKCLLRLLFPDSQTRCLPLR
jgi:hypothetical protein